MKKLAALALFSLLAAAAAQASPSAYSTAMPTNLPGKLSQNVQLSYDHYSDQSGYSVGTYHAQGTKTYASSSGDAAIYVSGATGVTIPDAPTGTASASWTSGTWTPL